MVVLFAGLLASCSATGEPTMQLEQPDEPAASTADAGADPGVDAVPAIVPEASANLTETAEPGPMPEQTALPAATAQSPPVTEQTGAETALAAGKDNPEKALQEAIGTTLAPSPTGQVLENGGPILTAGTMPEPPPKKKGFLSSFFGSAPARAKAAEAPGQTAPAATAAAREAKAKPTITFPDPNDGKRKEEAAARFAALGAQDDGMDGGGDFTLPGVRRTNLFEIRRKSGIDDDSDIDVYEDTGSYDVASAAGMARLAPNGLLKQRDSVDTACLKPQLVRMLKQVEQRFGKRLIVTSGYRSASYNKKVRGAEKSQHMYCAAVDVQLPGVPKFELARYLRSLPGRGGVGTYCHSSIHVDIGPERDWNWKCSARKT